MSVLIQIIRVLKPLLSKGFLPRQIVIDDKIPKPKSMKRAKIWTSEVENLFRLQTCGYRDIYEYQETCQGPELWSNGLYKMVEVKAGGYTYWNHIAECSGGNLGRVKIYSY